MVVAEQDERPVFDRNRLSWADAKARDMAAMRLSFYALQLDKAKTGSAEEFEQVLQGYSEALAVIERTLSLILVSVPRSWLVEGAPDNVDWSDPASFGWIREQKMLQLRVHAQDETTPQGITGN